MITNVRTKAEVAVVLAETATVRVTKNGNAKTLAVPARVAELATVDVGDVFQVHAEGNDRLVFDRVTSPQVSRYVGRGRDRVFEVGPEGFLVARRDTVTLRPVSWDF